MRKAEKVFRATEELPIDRPFMHSIISLTVCGDIVKP